MPFKIIASQCTGCSACELECPNVAISEKGGTFVIEPKKCTECIGHFDEPQCVAVCPVDNTCVLDPSLPRAIRRGHKESGIVNSTLTPAAEKFMSFEVRAHCAAETGFRLAVTAYGCSGLSVDVGVARAPESGEQVGERNDLNSLYAGGRPLVGGVTIVSTDTAAQTGLIFPEAGVLL